MLDGPAVAGQHAGISIIPPGPAVGFPEETSFNITCTSNRQGNITWALPVSSDELDNFQNKVLHNWLRQFYESLRNIFVTSFRGYMTCQRGPKSLLTEKAICLLWYWQSTKQRNQIRVVILAIPTASIFFQRRSSSRPSTSSFRVCITRCNIGFNNFIILCIATRIGKGVFGVELNPLKSVYVVTSSQPLFVVPCFNHFPSHYFSLVDLVLQKKKLTPPSSSGTLWESVRVSFEPFRVFRSSVTSVFLADRLISRQKLTWIGHSPIIKASPFVIQRAASTGVDLPSLTARARRLNGPSTVFSSLRVSSFTSWL